MYYNIYISIHTSAQLLSVYSEHTRASAALNSQACYGRIDSDCMSNVFIVQYLEKK